MYNIIEALGLKARYMFKYISRSVAQQALRQCFDQNSQSIMIEI